MKVDLSKLFHPDLNKSRQGKIFSLNNILTKDQKIKIWPNARLNQKQVLKETSESSGLIDFKQKELKKILMGVLKLQSKIDENTKVEDQ